MEEKKGTKEYEQLDMPADDQGHGPLKCLIIISY